MSVVEVIAIVFSIAYLVLAVGNRAACFVVGVISSILWAYASYYHYNLQWDALLNVFYALMSVYGLYAWTRGGPDHQPLPITERSWRQHSVYLGSSIVAVAIMTWSGLEIMGTNFPFWDATTTVLSVLGTFLITRRVLSCWLYLLVADVLYVGIYALSGAYLFMGMMVIYSVMAVVGWRSWQSIIDKDQSPQR